MSLPALGNFPGFTGSQFHHGMHQRTQPMRDDDRVVKRRRIAAVLARGFCSRMASTDAVESSRRQDSTDHCVQSTATGVVRRTRIKATLSPIRIP